MADNCRIWNVLGKTDPAHTKSFTRSGGFKGTAIKPIWASLRMTELFGPCGIGWGMIEPVFQVVPAGEEILVFCTSGIWYREDGEDQSRTVFGVGGDKVVTKGKDGPRTSDEAFKASYTDALSNAMKQIGVGADVHMGLFDDHKYVREMKEEFAAAHGESEKPSPAPKTEQAPKDPKAAVPLWQRDNFHIPVYPLDGGIGTDWVKWRRQIGQAIEKAPNQEALLKLQRDNADAISRYKEADAADWGDLSQVFFATLDKIKGKKAA